MLKEFFVILFLIMIPLCYFIHGITGVIIKYSGRKNTIAIERNQRRIELVNLLFGIWCILVLFGILPLNIYGILSYDNEINFVFFVPVAICFLLDLFKRIRAWSFSFLLFSILLAVGWFLYYTFSLLSLG